MAALSLSSLDAERVAQLSSERGEPDWLAQQRIESAGAYLSLPLETSPLYGKYTSAGALDPDGVLLGAGEDGVPAWLRARLGELAESGSAYAVQVGSRTEACVVPGELASAGLEVMPVSEAVRRRPDLAREAIESAEPSEDRFTALNGAAFDSGFIVSIADGAEIDRPVHLVSCLPGGGRSVIARNVLIAGERSRASVVQEVYSRGSEENQSYIELVSTRVREHARLDVTTLQMMDERAVNFSTRRARVERGASTNWYLGLFGSRLSRYRIDYDLAGEGASTTDSEVAFGSGEQVFDIQSRMNHLAPSTEGRVTEKSILRDRSRSLFKGMIRIREAATGSNSYLSGRSILLDPGASSDSIPGLEIETNDVKATHSASVAQVDDEQVFYLQARCLSRRQAERTIVEGFLEPLSRKMSYQVRAWIAALVESKWDGSELRINTDEELQRLVEVEETRYNENAELEQHYKYR